MNFRTYTKPLEDMGLMEEFGLPEFDEMIPAPVQIIRDLGLPTPADLILNLKAEVDRTMVSIRREVEKAVKAGPPPPHRLIGDVMGAAQSPPRLGEPMGAAQSSYS